MVPSSIFSVWDAFAYVVKGASVTEDEVDGALDEAILEVVPALVITEGVLGAHETATVECGHVARDAECGSLPSINSRRRRWNCILSILQPPHQL
jgi:hypothetical protein